MIFCSAINPWPATREAIAIGMSAPTGVSVFTSPDDGMLRHKIWDQRQTQETNSDVLAVDWLSPNLLAAGLRDATVVLYDIRAQKGVERMKHSGGILNLKRADVDTRFVVAGMGAKMALYDLRALRKEDAPQFNSKQKREKSHSKKAQGGVPETRYNGVAKPVVTFRYENQYHMMGMDVCAELGVVAAAEHGGWVRISSLRTGESIARWNVKQDEGDMVGDIRFIEDAMGVTKVLVSCRSRIVELSWQAGDLTERCWV
jgi:WD40 repeat protein